MAVCRVHACAPSDAMSSLQLSGDGDMCSLSGDKYSHGSPAGR